jgi:hypothetical protein
VTEPRAIATVAPAASWCGEITQENLSQNAQIRRRRKRIGDCLCPTSNQSQVKLVSVSWEK